jgi:3-hydroxyisobutyrate dehydrogenase
MRVGVIGLGSMGLGMARSLLAKGHEVVGCDVDPVACAAFKAAGGGVGNSPAEAARGADALVVVVLNADQTAAVLSSDVLAAMAPNGVVISCATMAPQRAAALAESVSGSQRLYLDAPMSGGAARAAQGALTFMAAGSAAAFARARPALDAMAAKVYELGAEPGQGAAVKIINQLLAGVHLAAMGEALAFARRMGLDLATVVDVIKASAGNSWMFENRAPRVVAGDYTPTSSVEIFVKDLGIVSDIGRVSKFPLPIAGAALQMFLMASAAGMGADDDSSIARVYARLAGLDLPGGK